MSGGVALGMFAGSTYQAGEVQLHHRADQQGVEGRHEARAEQERPVVDGDE